MAAAVELPTQHHRLFSAAPSAQRLSEQASTAPAPSTSGTNAASTSTAPSTLLHGKRSIKDFNQKHYGYYYEVTAKRVPEASRELYQSFYSPREAGPWQHPGGCTAFQREQQVSKRPAVMYRSGIRDLIRIVDWHHQAGQGHRLLVKGPTGSGKSMALLSLVDWARSQGCLVMYVPSATALTSGGYFTLDPGTRKYDTLISAQHMLKGIADAHGAQLSALKLSSGSGTLMDLVKQGLSTDSNARLAVDSCLRLKQELVLSSGSGSQRVLFVIDDYNALHWSTGYGRTDDAGQRVALSVKDLNLASGMRLLKENDTQKAVVVAAETCSRGISPLAPVDKQLTALFQMHRYTEVETAHALYWYYECGRAPTPPSRDQVHHLQAVTAGNANEVREAAVNLTMLRMRRL